MALFSFRHSVRTFSPKRAKDERAAEHGQTLAHLRCITRPSAARVVLRARVGGDAEAARAAEHAAEKRGGRVAERFIFALPVEATAEQRVALAQVFAEELTRGVAGYVLAIHDARGNDARNPHCHLVAFDAFEKTGGRGRPRSVMGMAREGAVERAAALWARLHNERMDSWGYGTASGITNLSLEARGIDRVPTIHEGAAARKMAARGAPMATKDPWKRIDAGHTRAMANRIIREINQLKERGDDDDRGDGLGGGDDSRAPERGEGGDARERSVGGVAEMLHRQSRHSSDLAAATKALAQIDARLSSLIEESRATRSALAQLSRSQPPRPRLWPSLALSVVLAALVASAVCSWS